MATPRDIDHAALMRHVADVIEAEFTGHQDWTCCAHARQLEDAAIVQRIRDMAVMAEHRA